ncbi:type I-E CRISPR-associated protein Cas5/CasD [Nordella sp. HKS 07]|uniref:type I-E CRISPR-associated protein Cas5/CasD n=1 Tax=Nordella sp. HKS 07 TaxID=2712222 RepID=UPI0013E19E2B|nr:type I-E CRISPR-associated protein Cas5/CasD [Nordella sp. HKS 07]QIG47924.1 type I-E CRISPR-associated protein Cas5/CasD [Nordella sp. HKS 07]
MSFFTIRFKGPLAALQGPRIDGEPQTLPIPTPSLITGMIGAALGISRAEAERLQALQDGMRLACVVHKPGVEVIDYQIADLSKPYLVGPMWSSGARIVEREGSQITGLRQQWKPYLADVDMTLVVELDPSAPNTAEEIIAAFHEPARPLFLGRSSCPPDVALAGAIIEAAGLEDAVNKVASERSSALIYLPAGCTQPQWGDLPVSIPGRRDWPANRHSGSELYVCRQPAAVEPG